ncbi:unnamed protein product [Fusarium fujikuroi]|nr:unnamed protein product [Fusarium fujikuroi]
MRPLPQPPWMRNYRRKVPSIIASIRNLPEGVTPTLESIPQIDESLKATEPFSPFSSLIRDMQETEFERWGEDCETLSNASKEQVRDRFSQWASKRSIERDGTGAEDPLAELLPGYRYCIYVDEKCLDTVDQYAAWSRRALKVMKGLSSVSCWMGNANPEAEVEMDIPLSKGVPRNTQAGFAQA